MSTVFNVSFEEAFMIGLKTLFLILKISSHFRTSLCLVNILRGSLLTGQCCAYTITKKILILMLKQSTIVDCPADSYSWSNSYDSD